MKTYRKLTRQKEQAFFEQFEGVVFGVLKRMNINFLYSDYEDYLQLGRIKLVEAYEDYPDDPWNKEMRGKFVGYAFTKIRWAILDAMRKKSRLNQNEQEWNDLFDATLPSLQTNFINSILEQEWLKEVLNHLNAEERRLVIDLCVYRLSITEIAKKEGVSRKTIYQRRRRVKRKLQATLYKDRSIK